MLKNYLKIALRALYRDKWYSIVNIGGLAIGMCVALLLFLYVKHELSFDKFHEDYQRIYRLHNHFTREGLDDEKLPCTLYNTGTAIIDDVPEVELLTRIFFWGTGEITVDNEAKSAKQIIYTDTTFFSLFTFPIIQGDNQNPLAQPNQIAITESVAKEWFGNENPIGKSIQIFTYDYDTLKHRFFQKPQILSVSALIADLPKNSHLRFDIVTNFTTMPEIFFRGQGQDFFTYIKLIKPLNEDIKNRIGEINAIEIEKGIGNSRPKEGTKTELMPLQHIHLKAKYPSEKTVTGNAMFVMTLGIVAALVLIIASINFVNLSTARADNRKREVGIRKTVGSNRTQIIIQFIGESILSSLLALIIALMLIELLITPFNALLNTSLSLAYKQNFILFLYVIVMAIFVGAIGGMYPSFYISRFKPIAILKGTTNSGKQNSFIKSVLIVFQFGIASILVFGLIVINSQMNFMKKKDLGFDQENIVLFFGISESLNKSYKAVQEDISSIPNVVSVSAAQSFPSGGLSGMSLSLEGSDPSTAFSVKENRIQDHYIKTLRMQIVKGRDFMPNAPADDEGYIINETAARMLGLPNPIDARVMMWRRPGKIIGVVKDYHLTSLRDDIDPLVISRYNPSINNITVKIEEFNKVETINQITAVLQKHDPNYNPNYKYLKDFLLKQYGSEERTFKLILSASILALILSMVGLYALSSYSIANRTKELGIRKILGASLSNLLKILLTDSTKWVLVANIVALPIGWYFSKNWLNDFTYRIELTPWIFLSAILLTYSIAVLTVTWQVFRAARANPVDALRCE
ncbi:MAG: hypothetical protein CVT98_01725 [Bacteroidetes bacterium HGW-Bacteroidetes-15]|nr:MAG: hypothetical protein CVT98_01725 [Bacteroidetes bacterium HGW-Bacteroidetes-15]